ncbi:MAG TPA: hypothetical protein VFW77_02910 [Candidatus Saccharimonadales bacterium]|nr:hypothetical protein [Candidatus Saccharimonadales bacterium]
MASIEAQGELLNEFVGRTEPSPELVDRAQGLVEVWDEINQGPAMIYARAANETTYDKIDATDSKVMRGLYKAVIVGRASLSLLMDSPRIVKCMVSESSFERQLKREYGWTFHKPSPNPEYSRRPVPKKPIVDYARELIELKQNEGETVLA